MNYLLIHGGWQGGWCWEGVVAELKAKGHEAIAPTLPGLDPAPNTDRSRVGLRAFIDAVSQTLRSTGLKDVILVAHSGGGPVAQGVYEQNPELVREVIFVDAWVLHDGESINDVIAPEMASGFVAASEQTSDQTVPMPEEFWVGGLCNDQTPADAIAWMDRVVPCPIGWFTEKASLPTFATSNVAKAYVFLDDDVTVDRSIYESMAQRLSNPRTATSAGAHEAMLSQPRLLTDAIVSVSLLG